MKKFFIYVVSAIVICAAMFCFGGCKKSDSDTTIEREEVEVKVLLSKTAASLDIDETLTLSVTTNIKDATGFVWTSSNESVAIVSDNGEVTAKSVGVAVITVSIEGKSATCTINVYDSYPYPVINVVETSLRLAVGDTYFINAKVIYRGVERDVAISYTTENDQIATVSQDGIITATGVGLVKITINAEYESILLQETLDLAVLNNELL